MTDRLITLGLTDASPETRQAAENAALRRRVAALERAGSPNPTGTILPYAGAASGGSEVTISTLNNNWSTLAATPAAYTPFSTGNFVGAVAENSTYLYARRFSVISARTLPFDISGPISRITKSTGAIVDLGSTVGTEGDNSVNSATVPYEQTNALAADDTYVYYAVPSDLESDVRRVYRVSATATTGAGSSFVQVPSGRYMTALAVTPDGVGTRYLYAVLDDNTIWRSPLTSPTFGAAAIFDASTVVGSGVAITSLSIAGTTPATDHTAGDLYIGLSNGTIMRRDAGGAARTEGGSPATWTLAFAPYGVTASNSHIYFTDSTTLSRITISTTGTSATSDDLIEYNIADTPDMFNVRQVANRTGTALYYVSGSSSIGRISNAETTTPAYVDPPDGYLRCDGQAVSRDVYPNLFNTIGTTYGVGDGSTTFNVPDLQGRVPVGRGQNANVLTLGQADATAVANRQPAHSHTCSTDGSHTHIYEDYTAQNGVTNYRRDSSGVGFNNNAITQRLTASAGSHTHTVGSTGGTNNAPSFIVLNYIIKY